MTLGLWGSPSGSGRGPTGVRQHRGLGPALDTISVAAYAGSRTE